MPSSSMKTSPLRSSQVPHLEERNRTSYSKERAETKTQNSARLCYLDGHKSIEYTIIDLVISVKTYPRGMLVLEISKQ